MESIQKRLLEMADEKYADFQAKLAPTIGRELCIGVRVPELRRYATEIRKDGSWEKFIEELPHKYYDENLLHSILLEKVKPYDRCIIEVERFLPFVDNWAACDTLRPAVFKRHKAELMEKIIEWIASEETYIIRFGVDMLMTHYLDEDFKPEYLELPLDIKSEEYYVKMMIAWYYATALAKQWDDTIRIIEDRMLDIWTHNKTIQKAIESRRITDEQKSYLRTLKRA